VREGDEETPSARTWIPARGGVRGLAEALDSCRGCELWADATQAVPGHGPARADLMIIGEQPGDREDRAGEPFVGPAGRLLREVMDELGVPPGSVFLTNAVKHFRHRGAPGKRRIHEPPAVRHVSACSPWLAEELARVKPSGVVLLGAVAASAVLGREFRVSEQRGVVLPWPDDRVRRPAWVLATVHPAAVLRSKARREERVRFSADLGVAFEQLRRRPEDA
jgi:uracil-DNA glycosylase family protein